MALKFTRASSQYLRCTSTPVSTYPCTMSAWIKRSAHSAGNSVIHSLVSVGRSTASHNQFTLAINDQTSAADYGYAGTFPNAVTTPDVGAQYQSATVFDQTSDWILLIGVWHAEVASPNVSFYTCKYGDGAFLTDTDDSDNAATAFDRLYIGARCYTTGSQTDFADGYLAHIALWNSAITNADQLAALRTYTPDSGQSGLATPVAYWPLSSDGDYTDYAGSYNMTAPGNAPTWDSGVALPTLSSGAGTTAAVPNVLRRQTFIFGPR